MEEAVMSDRKYTRERLFLLLDSDSEERAAFLRRFTEDEQKALIYRFHKGPGLGRVDLNLTPPPPFPDRQMKKVLQSAGKKVLQLELETLDRED